MTSLELLRALGGVSTENLAGAEKLQWAEAMPVKHKPALKRAFLVAAVIALLLLLVGCAAVYVLHLQDLKVGEYRLPQNPAYDASGNVVPVATHPLRTQISLQGANQEALMEWQLFLKDTNTDPETVKDTTNTFVRLPENYRSVYNCSSFEMAEKLDEITGKYDLKLLSPVIDCDSFESSVLFGALGIGPLYQGTAEYVGGYFYPEGTFEAYLIFDVDSEQWRSQSDFAWYHFSQKTFFDTRSGVIEDAENCTQWNYTRKDGRQVLLVLEEERAWIFADRSDAFITISFSSFKWKNGEKVRMPQNVLEEIAEHFDLDVQPQTVNVDGIEDLRAQAKADDEAKRQEAARQKYSMGYENYIRKKLDGVGDSYLQDGLYYALYDLNGDGVEELLSGGKISFTEILSMRNGESYSYANVDKWNMGGFLTYTVCEDRVLALKDYFTDTWYYLRAEAEGLTYLEGLTKREDTWFSIPEKPPAPPEQMRSVQITQEQAKAIQDSYVPLEVQPEAQLMKRFGQPVRKNPWTDPYARYIWDSLDRHEEAENFVYTLRDLNGDGVKELITKDAWTVPAGHEEPQYDLQIHTIVDGELVRLGSYARACEDDVFMDLEYDGTYYEFCRMKGNEMKMIEKVFVEPFDLYWGHVKYGDFGVLQENCSEEDAMKFVNAYKEIDLPMKPFDQYPFS